MKKKIIIITLLSAFFLFISWMLIWAWQKYYIGVKIVSQYFYYQEINEYVKEQGTFPDNIKSKPAEMFNGDIIPEAYGISESVLLKQQCFGRNIITYGNGRTVLMNDGEIISEISWDK